jgi:L-fuculose-phosphate aldolase
MKDTEVTVFDSRPTETLVSAMRQIYGQGLTTTSGGNLSLLDAKGRMWITPSGTDKGRMKQNDLMMRGRGGSVFLFLFPFH